MESPFLTNKETAGSQVSDLAKRPTIPGGLGAKSRVRPHPSVGRGNRLARDAWTKVHVLLAGAATTTTTLGASFPQFLRVLDLPRLTLALG